MLKHFQIKTKILTLASIIFIWELAIHGRLDFMFSMWDCKSFGCSNIQLFSIVKFRLKYDLVKMIQLTAHCRYTHNAVSELVNLVLDKIGDF